MENNKLSPIEERKMSKDWQSLISMGLKAREMKDKSQWVLGDLAVQIDTIYGEDAIGEFAVDIDVNKNTLVTYRTVSKAWKPEERMYRLSHRHHMILAGREDRQKWLEEAHDGNWTIERLGVELKKHDTGVSMLPVRKSVALIGEEVASLIAWGKFFTEKSGMTTPLDIELLARLDDLKKKIAEYQKNLPK